MDTTLGFNINSEQDPMLSIFQYLLCSGFRAQSTQRGHVEHSQFT